MHFSMKVGLFANRNDAKIIIFNASTPNFRVFAAAYLPYIGMNLERCEWNL